MHTRWEGSTSSGWGWWRLPRHGGFRFVAPPSIDAFVRDMDDPRAPRARVGPQEVTDRSVPESRELPVEVPEEARCGAHGSDYIGVEGVSRESAGGIDRESRPNVS